MSCLFLSYLLGACFQLSLISSETVTSPPRMPYKLICNSTLVDGIEHFCKDLKRRQANIPNEATLQTKPLLDILDSSHPKDADAFNALLESIPEFPQEMKTMFSDGQSLLRKSQYSKEKMNFRKAVAILVIFCCSDNCVVKAKKNICNP